MCKFKKIWFLTAENIEILRKYFAYRQSNLGISKYR